LALVNSMAVWLTFSLPGAQENKMAKLKRRLIFFIAIGILLY
jgi:hypothetical protein